MKKVITISLLVLSIILAVIIILIQKYKNNNFEKESIITVKTDYYYQSDDEFSISLYSNSRSSFLLDYQEYTLSITDEEEQVIVPKLLDVTLNKSVTYNGNTYYEYLVYIKIIGNDINLINAKVLINYDCINFSVLIGSLNYYSSNNLTPFKEYQTLCGISKSSPYLTINGVYLTINNRTNKDMIITSPSLKNYKLYFSLVEKYIDNHFESYELNNLFFNTITVKAHETINVLILIDTSSDIFINTFPLFFNVNGVESYISKFNYLKINDLNDVNSLINIGVFDGI